MRLFLVLLCYTASSSLGEPQHWAQPKGQPSTCPPVTEKPAAHCGQAVSTCWSPGVRDTDCPGHGLCCFDGCADTCLGAPVALAPLKLPKPAVTKKPVVAYPQKKEPPTYPVKEEHRPPPPFVPYPSPLPDPSVPPPPPPPHREYPQKGQHKSTVVHAVALPKIEKQNKKRVNHYPKRTAQQYPVHPGVSRSRTSCPQAPPRTHHECLGRQQDTCWSPGHPDTDCPGHGLCCFDGCANTCAGPAPIYPPPPRTTPRPTDPCNPSPCGPGTTCMVNKDGNPVCRCKPGLIPRSDTIEGCDVECHVDPDCQYGHVCLRNKCVPKPDPCNPSPCGPGTRCVESRTGNPVCQCEPGLVPKPDTITGCGPECYTDPDCDYGLVCRNQKCVERPDPCDPSPCGPRTTCVTTRDGNPQCRCLPGFVPKPDTITGCGHECTTDAECVGHYGRDFICEAYKCVPKPDPCHPSPCGPGATCRMGPFDNAICECLPGLIPKPDTVTGCGPECTTDYDCGQGFICQQQRCVEKPDPCQPSPCGPGAFCMVDVRGNAICKCEANKIARIDTIIGCDYECQRDYDCGENFICTNYRCVEKPDPCNPSPCGPGAFCSVHPLSGNPICKCEENKIPLGDTIQGCDYECRVDRDCPYNHECLNFHCVEKRDPCDPNPCGMMAICHRNGDQYTCECPKGTFGDAYAGCQQGECLIDDDCALERACIDFFCINPCLTNSTCRAQDFCQVRNHIPVCGYNFDEPPKVRTPIVIGGKYEPPQPAAEIGRPFVIGGRYNGQPKQAAAAVVDARRGSSPRAVGAYYRRKKREEVSRRRK